MMQMLNELKKAKLEIKLIVNQRNGGNDAFKDINQIRAVIAEVKVEEERKNKSKNKPKIDCKKNQSEKGKYNKLKKKEHPPHHLSNFFSLKSNFFSLFLSKEREIERDLIETSKDNKDEIKDKEDSEICQAGS